MGDVISFMTRAKLSTEERDKVYEIRLTGVAAEQLEQFAKWCQQHGVPQATAQTAAYAFVMDGITAWVETMQEIGQES